MNEYEVMETETTGTDVVLSCGFDDGAKKSRVDGKSVAVGVAAGAGVVAAVAVAVKKLVIDRQTKKVIDDLKKQRDEMEARQKRMEMILEEAFGKDVVEAALKGDDVK